MGEVLSRGQMKRKADELRASGKKIVFTNGCFDLLHVGHTRYLRNARELGDVLIVGLNSDSSVRKIKGEGRPIVPEGERAEVLASLACVDYVVVFEEDRPDSLLKSIRPHIHVKGGDYSIQDIPERKSVESHGGKVVILKKVERHSTRNIIQKILKAYGNKKRG
jgi:D-beta-D-heptose 7-phosphate kinase/D-beta-D-heptose 1-phosphate adenosyltransferase